MNLFEHKFYQKLLLALLTPDNFTIDFWLKTKDYWLRGVEPVTKRHRRSIAQRDLHRLFPQYKIRSYHGYPLRTSTVLLKTADGLTRVDSPRFKYNIWEPCHRLIWKKEGVK